MIEWSECPLSGHIRGTGNRAEYWISSSAWTYVHAITWDYAGPNSKEIGAKVDMEEAKLAAEEYDAEEGE